MSVFINWKSASSEEIKKLNIKKYTTKGKKAKKYSFL